MAESLYPPHSRLFVACDKDTTDAEITSAFKSYGNLAKVNLCKDRETGRPKGFAFVQFDKTSEAAAAMEALHGNTIGHSTRPVKVTVAMSKDHSGSTNTIDPSQFLRLFLVVPKSATEDSLREHFSQFGSISSVTIVKDRETKESKGYAFVKFRMFSDAARAYENCDRMYKVVFAKPKEQQGGSRPSEQASFTPAPYMEPVLGCTHIDENPDGFTCLRGLVSMDLTDEQIEWLFDIPPGLEFVRFFNEMTNYDPRYSNMGPPRSRKVMVQYDSPGTAAYALRKLDGFPYPAGDRVILKPDSQSAERMPGAWQEGGRQERRSGENPHSVSNLMRQVEILTKNLSEATQMIKSAGISATSGKPPVKNIEPFRCSANLPPPQPLAPSNSVAQERLFVVCEPGLPPQDALWDVFGRFGNLMDLYILNGKNCGFVKYSDKNSAQKAMETLNGQDLYRMKLKVMIAEPQREDRKRPRTNYD